MFFILNESNGITIAYKEALIQIQMKDLSGKKEVKIYAYYDHIFCKCKTSKYKYILVYTHILCLSE